MVIENKPTHIVSNATDAALAEPEFDALVQVETVEI